MERLRTTTQRRMTCECCRRYGSDHAPDEDRVPDDEAMAWFVHSMRHHRGTVRVEKVTRGVWVLIDEFDLCRGLDDGRSTDRSVRPEHASGDRPAGPAPLRA